MGFESMLAFLLTPALAWIIALYFIKSKPRKRKLPSTAFWAMVMDKVKENALWQRYRGTIFLLLQLLAVAAGIMSLAKPFKTGGLFGDLIVVMDTSASMRSRDGSPTRFDSARSAALSLMDKLSGDVRVMVVELGARPRIALPFTSEVAKAKAALSAMKCTAASGCSSAEGLTFLSSLKTKDTKNVFLFGDGFDGQAAATTFPGARVKVRTFGTKNDNKAITSFKVAGSAQRATVTMRVTNYSKTIYKGVAELQGMAMASEQKSVELPPANAEKGPSEKMVVFKKLQFLKLPEVLRARIKSSAGDDLLPDDDEAWLLMRRERVRVAVITTRQPKVIMRLLGSLPHLEPIIMNPTEFLRRKDELKTFALVIADDYINDDLLKKPLICFHPLRSSGLSSGTAANNPRPYVGDTTHPVMRYLGFPGLQVKRTVVLDKTQGGVIILSCEHGPMITCLSKGEARQVICSFPINQSNLSFKVGFPVFLTNALRWILGEDLQLAVGYKAGTLVAAPKGKGPVKVSHSDPVSGAKISPSSKSVNATSGPMNVFENVGVYELARGDWKVPYPVSILNAGESDIAPRGPAEATFGKEQEGGGSGSKGGYWRYFALAFLVFIGLEWVLYCIKGV